MSVYPKKRKNGSIAWFYDFTIKGIRHRGVGGTTRTQAETVERKLRTDALNDEFEIIKKCKNPTIEKFAEKYLLRRKNKRSIERDEFSIKQILIFFKGKKIGRITSDNIEDYILKRNNDGVTNSTINRELACLKRMYNLAIRWNDTKKNPVNEIDFLEEPPGRTRFLSEEEAQRLLKECSDYLYPLVFTALNTGMRISELLDLKWQSIYIENTVDPYIDIISTSNQSTKSNKNRQIYLQDELVDLFKELRKTKVTEYVFVSKKTGLPIRDIRTPFKNALKRANIENFTIHDLRHTFASHFIMRGGDPLTLKETLGHSSMKMVERYTHLAKNYKRKQMNNLKGVFTGKKIRKSGRIIEMENK